MATHRKPVVFFLICIFTVLIFLHRRNSTKYQLMELASEDESLERNTFNNFNINVVPCDPENQSNSCITLVTGYFAFAKAKHNVTQYIDWLQNFLGQVTNPVVIFTQPSLQPLMAKLREGKPTHFLIYDTIWDIPWLNKPKFLYKYYHKMHDIDPEKALHSPELYSIWNSKPWMLQTVSDLNPFNSTYFFWMDIGSVRSADTNLIDYPSVEKAIQVFGKDERSENFHKLNVFTTKKFEGYKSGNSYEEMQTDFVIGGFYGGSALGVNWFSKEFYDLHDSKLNEGLFVGKDQTMYNWIVTQQSDKFLVVCSCFQSPGEGGDRWFYFLAWYGTRNSNSGCEYTPVRNMSDFLNEYNIS